MPEARQWLKYGNTVLPSLADLKNRSRSAGGSRVVSEGEGHSKKEAQLEAARKALVALENEIG